MDRIYICLTCIHTLSGTDLAFILQIGTVLEISGADPERFDADPDPTFQADADPALDLDPKLV